MSQQNKTPLINLTRHQRDKLKTTLDGIILQAGMALAFGQLQRCDELMARHDKITDALADLNITIEGHEQNHPRQARNAGSGVPDFITREYAE